MPYISDLVKTVTEPAGTDDPGDFPTQYAADKGKILDSFPNVSGECSATHTELNAVDGATAGTAVASKAVVLDASKNISGLGAVSGASVTASGAVTGGSLTDGTATIASGTITGSTITDGVASLSSGTMAGMAISNPVLNGGVSGTAIDTDTTLAADSNSLIAPQAAVKAHVAAAIAAVGGGTVAQIKFAAASGTSALSGSYATRTTVTLTNVDSANDVLLFLIGNFSVGTGTNLVVNMQITDSSNTSVLDGADTVNFDHNDEAGVGSLSAMAVDTAPGSGTVSYRARASISGSGSASWEHCALVAIEFTP